MSPQRRGFTLIEILITIGIILVLVGIVSVGITYVTKSGRNNAAKVTLNNLRGMIAELEAGAGLRGRQPLQMWAPPEGDGIYPPGLPTVAPAEMNIWQDANPAVPGTTPPYTNEPAFVPEAAVSNELAADQTAERYAASIIANTQLVMGLLLADPDNKRMIGQFPAEQLMEKLPGTGAPTKMTIETATRNPVPVLPLDPWRNPIIFVPGAGLCGDASPTADDSMWIGGPPGFLDPATPAKQVVAVVTNASTQVGPIRSPDGRPFWASAGPDGDFRTADDNLYSFEN